MKIDSIYHGESSLLPRVGEVGRGRNQVTDYYPFGMEIPLFSSSNNQLKYNSKELQTEAELEWHE